MLSPTEAQPTSGGTTHGRNRRSRIPPRASPRGASREPLNSDLARRASCADSREVHHERLQELARTTHPVPGIVDRAFCRLLAVTRARLTTPGRPDTATFTRPTTPPFPQWWRTRTYGVSMESLTQRRSRLRDELQEAYSDWLGSTRGGEFDSIEVPQVDVSGCPDANKAQ